MHVKVFRFRISNKVTSGISEDCKTDWYNAEVMQLSSSDDISNILNNFSLGKDIKHIEVTPITCKQNLDRDRDDIVDILYTIVWEEQSNNAESETYSSFDKKIVEQLRSKIRKEDKPVNIYAQNFNPSSLPSRR